MYNGYFSSTEIGKKMQVFYCARYKRMLFLPLQFQCLLSISLMPANCMILHQPTTITMNGIEFLNGRNDVDCLFSSGEYSPAVSAGGLVEMYLQCMHIQFNTN